MANPVEFSTLYRSTGNFIDLYAEGHYARVLQVHDLRRDKAVAFKVLRLEHLESAPEKKLQKYNAYGLEVRLLQKLSDESRVVDLLDCGFVSDKKNEAPNEGQIVSFGTDVETFNEHLPEYMQMKWRPYLSEVLMPNEHNLYLLLTEKDNQQQARRLPVEEGLDFCLQYSELLQRVHEHDIVYNDYKTAHFYWDGVHLCVIDWNNSTDLNGNGYNSQEAMRYKQTDIRSFILGVMYPVFTGLSPLVNVPLPSGPADYESAFSRYNGVRELDFGVKPTLVPCLMDMMIAGVNGDYKDITQFTTALQSCALHYGWEFSNRKPQIPAVRSRGKIRAGLQALRQAQGHLAQAQRCFTEALEEDCSDLEAQRLLKATEEFLTKRVIP